MRRSLLRSLMRSELTWGELILTAVTLWLSAWAGVRVWASQPPREPICPDICHCLPECPPCAEAPR